jgi:hypothetical protein
VYIIFTLSHPTASIVYSAKSLCICIWPNTAVSASIPTHKHGQKWPLRRLKVKHGDSLSPILFFIRIERTLFRNKHISKKLKLILKNTIIDKALTYALDTSTLTKRDRKQLNIFERKVYRRILDPVYDNEKENWRILTNKEIYAILIKITIRDNKAT